MSRLSDIILFCMHPITGSRRLQREPRWVAAFFLLAFILVVVTIAMQVFNASATAERLPPSANATQVIEQLHQEMFLRCAFLPFRLMAGWGTFSLLLYYVCKAFRPPEMLRFVQILALEIHAECAFVVSRIVSLVALALAAQQNDYQRFGFPFSGLWLVGPERDFVPSALLATLNIFTFWYIVLLAAGVSVLCGFRRFQAFLIVFAAWAASAGFNIGVLKLLKDTMHLLV